MTRKAGGERVISYSDFSILPNSNNKKGEHEENSRREQGERGKYLSVEKSAMANNFGEDVLAHVTIHCRKWVVE